MLIINSQILSCAGSSVSSELNDKPLYGSAVPSTSKVDQSSTIAKNVDPSVSIIDVKEKRTTSNDGVGNTFNNGRIIPDIREDSQEMVEKDGETSNHEDGKLFAKRSSKRQNIPNVKLFSSNKRAMRTFTTSCIILIVLICTYVPASIIVVIENIRGMYPFKLRPLIFSLPYLCSFLNPIIYFWRIPEFRQTLTQKCDIC